MRLHRLAVAHGVYRRSVRVALVVGTLLNLINQPDALMGLLYFDRHPLEGLNITKALLTYVVPFCVASYGALAALSSRTPDAGTPPRPGGGQDQSSCHGILEAHAARSNPDTTT